MFLSLSAMFFVCSFLLLCVCAFGDSTKDYYQELDVVRTASTKEIRKAYFSLAKIYHPDKNENFNKPKIQAKFERISKAYSVLQDEIKRKHYDRLLELGQVDYTDPSYGAERGNNNREETEEEKKVRMEQKLRNAQREREEQSTREAEEKAREWGLTIYLTIVFGIILFVLFWCSRKYFVYRSTWYKQYVKNQNFQQERKKLVETEKIRVHEREQMTKERQDLLQKLHEREEARQEAMVEALREYETQQKRIPSSEALEEPEKETYPKMETELEAEMDLDMKKKNGISQVE
eukprot:TRINITY_DN2764_c0_g1_i17.p1 TRINITY_DN2764_c0_g1~~TRINITY_DN2764_c0_g1_i17.p1  ORF type:complete len:325 (-),score=87.86 TRINITY_DN2764_c0_g1_i17:362-1234(-)